MKKFAEKGALLSLSLMLISSFSVSSALPLMLDYYSQYPADQVELLVSVPSFFVIAMLLANGLLNRYLSERQLLVSGLLLVSLAGTAPVLVQDYSLVLLSRMVLGMGLGMINAKAIAIISERYAGRERVQMLGLRGSAEVVGGALFTLMVGQLLTISWTWSFAIYAFGLVILVLYLVFVPKAQPAVAEEDNVQEKPARLLGQDIVLVLSLAVLAGLVVATNSAISLRLPSLIQVLNFGTATQASYVLTAEQLVGILAGLSFSPLLARLGRRMLQVCELGLGLSLGLMALSPNILVLSLGALLTGFFYSTILTTIFNQLSERIAPRQLTTATAVVLVGCNLGSALSPYLLKLISLPLPAANGFLLAFGLIGLLLAGLLTLLGLTRRSAHASR